MFSKFYNTSAKLWIAVEDLKNNPVALVKKLERGDADSSGSTMRTAGIVALILAIFGIVAVAVFKVATTAAGQITVPPFK